MPSARQARKIRSAISPRLATSSRRIAQESRLRLAERIGRFCAFGSTLPRLTRERRWNCDLRVRLGIAVVLVSAVAAAGAASARAGTALIVTGHGWGHGVGLSQWGAYGYALHGWKYRRILAHYYPGTKMGSVGEPPRACPAHAGGRIRHRGLRDADGRDRRQAADAEASRRDVRRRAAARPPGAASRGRALLRAPRRLRLPPRAARVRRARVPRDARPPQPGRRGLRRQRPLPRHVPPRCRPVRVAFALAARGAGGAGGRGPLVRRRPSCGRARGTTSCRPRPTRSTAASGPSGRARDRAVYATRGQVLTWDGQVARTYYSSSSGGRTEAVQDAWPARRRSRICARCRIRTTPIRRTTTGARTTSRRRGWPGSWVSGARSSRRRCSGTAACAPSRSSSVWRRVRLSGAAPRAWRGRCTCCRPGSRSGSCQLSVSSSHVLYGSRITVAARAANVQDAVLQQRSSDRRVDGPPAGQEPGAAHLPAAREHGVPPRRARHERHVGTRGCGTARAGACAEPARARRRGLAAARRSRRGVAPRARPVARRRAPDPRRQRQLQDAVAAPPRRVQDHGRRRQAGGYADVAPPDAADAPEPAAAEAGLRPRLQS